MVVLLASFLLEGRPAYAAEPDTVCVLTPADKAANARLSFDEFDQKGTLPSTWRTLSNRDCDLAAVEAMQSYLIEGAAGTPAERGDLLFHLGQSLAMTGRTQEAAIAVAAARNGNPEPDGFDWQTYVVGTWAFLVRDRERLSAMRDKLRTEPGLGNHLNTGALSGLLACFEKPYKEAYGKACRPASNPPVVPEQPGSSGRAEEVATP